MSTYAFEKLQQDQERKWATSHYQVYYLDYLNRLRAVPHMNAQDVGLHVACHGDMVFNHQRNKHCFSINPTFLKVFQKDLMDFVGHESALQKAVGVLEDHIDDLWDNNQRIHLLDWSEIKSSFQGALPMEDLQEQWRYLAEIQTTFDCLHGHSNTYHHLSKEFNDLKYYRHRLSDALLPSYLIELSHKAIEKIIPQINRQIRQTIEKEGWSLQKEETQTSHHR
ncbi:MAG: hypothetical protein OXC61_11770 [Flavobacteriaceae bacterium]|nr:hypothetical protein [Flavobacteriaceae bacterium]